ncbi:hypothetical protein FB45DRAFT_898284 [Roridomyces roridus]|uniref:F-box domain-containing protein n=1 Tax=Roridomyces roridus TaxID=1738132 RepID=A0AAD7CCF4_9AGAR|nr:hypothetical protein FB45DRAFT_898284 [Roridomyces roridus]
MSDVRLDEHVLGEILCICDVQSVIRFSQASKHCQRIACLKHVWISLICDLEFHGLRDRNPELVLEDCATQTLINLAKCVAIGPRTWSPASAVSPTLCREVVVSLDESVPRVSTIHLLPGGTHFVVYTADGHVLSLWAVATGRRIWRYQTRQWLPYCVEVRDGGEAVVFAFRTSDR